MLQFLTTPSSFLRTYVTHTGIQKEMNILRSNWLQRIGLVVRNKRQRTITKQEQNLKQGSGNYLSRDPKTKRGETGSNNENEWENKGHAHFMTTSVVSVNNTGLKGYILLPNVQTCKFSPWRTSAVQSCHISMCQTMWGNRFTGNRRKRAKNISENKSSQTGDRDDVHISIVVELLNNCNHSNTVRTKFNYKVKKNDI